LRLEVGPPSLHSLLPYTPSSTQPGRPAYPTRAPTLHSCLDTAGRPAYPIPRPRRNEWSRLPCTPASTYQVGPPALRPAQVEPAYPVTRPRRNESSRLPSQGSTQQVGPPTLHHTHRGTASAAPGPPRPPKAPRPHPREPKTLPYAGPDSRGPALGKSRRRTAYPQQIVTTRLLYCLQDRFAQLSRLQRI
jgi:hypothetical protein